MTVSRKKIIIATAALLFALAAVFYLDLIPFGKTSGASLSALEEQEPLIAKTPMLELLSPDQTGIDFVNNIVETEQNNVVKNINFFNGGGVCAGDFNNDGLIDVYFVSTSGKNKLYMNQGSLKFKENAAAAGVESAEGFESGATLADVNADGFLDIFVYRAGPKGLAGRGCQLFINNPSNPGHFTELASTFGLRDESPATGAIFFDYDLDGDLDCYLLNHPEDLTLSNSLQGVSDKNGQIFADFSPRQLHDSDRLYRNDGPGPVVASGVKTVKFTDVSNAAGIRNLGFGLSVSIGDLNFDGYPDIYVANDFVQPDNLYINNKNGGFDDRLKNSLSHNAVFSMGAELSDFDNDGLLDIFNLDMLPSTNYRQKVSKTTNPLSRYLSIVQYGVIEPVTRNTLQRNNGNGTFSDLACLSGIYKTDWAWSCLMSDLDNDGLKDIYITNGYPKDVNARDYQDFILPEATKKAPLTKMNYDQLKDLMSKIPYYKTRNFFYQNKGEWQFEDVSGKWASTAPSWSSGSAWADLDNDGDLELIVNNLEEPAFVYKNLAREQQRGNYLQVKLQGPAGNPLAYGASILIEHQGKRQFQELYPNKGAFSASEILFHFGVGQANSIDKLSLRWPDGKTQSLSNVPVNQRLTLKYGDAGGKVASLVAPAAKSLYFADVSAQSNVSFIHQENTFNDFERWQLNLWSVSDLGPLLAVGDVNADGLDDFFIGNAFDQAAALYVQQANGSFISRSEKLFDTFKNYEDNGAVFLDADGDGDQDLFVTSGGPDASSDMAWQPRLYTNNGNGEFSNETTVQLPVIKDLSLRAVPFDYDRDGDQDLFVGGRLTPNQWPIAPRSIVLQNNKGKFTDVTTQVGGDFTHCGMVTDLSWQDLNADGIQELIVVGEWMPVSVFALENNALKNVSSRFGLDNSQGIWQKLALADMDGDGDTDLVTGNLGLNTRFSTPMYCYAKDYDNNKTMDPIVAIEVDGKQYPLLQKDVLVKQIPSLKKKFLFAKDYATATVEQIFTAAAVKESYQLVCRELQSCWWENQQGKFIKHHLPVYAQSSVVQGIIPADFNGDGKMDLLLAGNKYGFEVETNSADASNGVLLLGDGKGGFSWVDNIQSGFWANREARDMALVKTKGKPMVLVANNNARPQIFKTMN